jgi:hypothetical protein
VKPEQPPPVTDVKKLQRKLADDEKKMVSNAKKKIKK